MTGEVQSADYVALLEAVKDEIAASRVRAARAVNAELISMYWRIGALILERQAAQGWGARVVERLAADLRASFPGARGLSRRNLHYMRAFAEAWHEEVPQPVAQLPWGHVRVLLDRLEDHEVRQWYATRDAAEGWSRAVLETMVASRLHLRPGSLRATPGLGRGCPPAQPGRPSRRGIPPADLRIPAGTAPLGLVLLRERHIQVRARTRALNATAVHEPRPPE